MLRKILNSLIVILFCNVASASSINVYEIMTEDYPPFNFEENNTLKGISVDVWGLVLKNLNSTQTTQNIKLLSWPRAYYYLQNNDHTMLFSMTKTPERENLFKWVGPIAPTVIALIAPKAKMIKIATLDDATKYRIGVIKNDVGEQLLQKNNFPMTSIEEVADVNQNIKKLIAGRVDMIAYEENVAKWSLKQQGANVDDYTSIFTLQAGYIYYAFSKNTPDSLIYAVQAALDQAKESDEYRQILIKYLN